MYRPPSFRKHKAKKKTSINLIPILDAVFIFIFFLLMSANFFQVFEIQSDVPMVSDTPPKNNEKPLGLTVEIRSNELRLLTGLPGVVRKTFGMTKEGDYDYLALHDYCVQLKKNHKQERTIVIDTQIDVVYEKIVKVMDAVRMLYPTDDVIYVNNKMGVSEEVRYLFDKIIFSNIF